MFKALRHRNYRLFFAGQLISLIGTWMQSVAQGWLVLRLTNSPFLLGVVAAASSLPILVLSLPAGVFADRLPKRSVIIFTQTMAMILAFILAGLTLTHTVQVWHVLVLATLLGASQALDAPARQAFVIELVGREDLLNAIGLNASMFNLARAVGPAAAGLVVAAVGEGAAFLLNALSFLAVLWGLLLMKLPPHPLQPAKHPKGQLREGLLYIRNEPTIRALLLLVANTSLFGFAYAAMLPVFARDVLHTGPSGLGYLGGASGFGALLAALALAYMGSEPSLDKHRGRFLLLTLFIFPFFVIGFTFTRDLPIAMVFLSFMGCSNVASLSLNNTLIQLLVPNTLRARVMSVFVISVLGVAPIGGLLAGSITEWVGSVPLVIALAALILIGLNLGMLLLVPQVRQLWTRLDLPEAHVTRIS